MRKILVFLSISVVIALGTVLGITAFAMSARGEEGQTMNMTVTYDNNP